MTMVISSATMTIASIAISSTTMTMTISFLLGVLSLLLLVFIWLARRSIPSEVKFDCLPDDLIRNILLRLPAKSIIRSRSVSKSWLAITTDPSFLLAHTNRSSYSLLIQTTKKRRSYQSYRDNLINFPRLLSPAPTPSGIGVVVSSILPERRHNTRDIAHACCDGLICLYDKMCEILEPGCRNSFYVINPLTGCHIDVTWPRFQGRVLGLYLHPPTGEYRIILRIRNKIIHNMVDVITLGGEIESWRMIRLPAKREVFCAPVPIDLKGNLYWFVLNFFEEFNAYVALVFDTTEEKFKLMPLPVVDTRQFTDSSLVHMGERLGFSIIDRELSQPFDLSVDIWVLKDHETGEWEKMHSVRCFGAIDFLLSHTIEHIAFFIKEELAILFEGQYSPFLPSHMVMFDLNSLKYRTEEVTDPEDTSMNWRRLLHKETLISYDSFLK